MRRRRPSPFGELAHTLRQYESRPEFAKRLGVGEGTIANVESGHRSQSKKLLDALVRVFPEDEVRLRADYLRSKDAPSLKTDRSADESTHRSPTIAHDIDLGRFAAARDSISLQLEESLSPESRFSLLVDLAMAHLGDPKSDNALAVQALEDALNCEGGNASADEVAEIRNYFASHLAQRDEFLAAHKIIEMGLVNDATNGHLWLRKGLVHWDQHEFSSAYAALTIALTTKHEGDRSLYFRGGVLADWGLYDLALGDLTFVIDNQTRHNFTAMTTVQARSWRAYVLAKQGDWGSAISEFEAIALRLEKDSLHHYLRGLCHHDNGEKEQALGELSAAIDPTMHSFLNTLKRERSISLVQALRPRRRVYKKKKA